MDSIKLKCIFLLLVLNSLNASALKLEGIYPVNKSEGLDLSGLVYCSGKLLTISDKHSETIYRLDKDANDYKVNIELEIDIPEVKEQKYQFPNNILYYLYNLFDSDNYDWEGITCNQSTILLVSERHTKLLSVEPGFIEWIDIDTSSVENAGLLETYNAFIEGVTIDEEYYYLSVERQPRGIVRVDRNTTFIHANVFNDIDNAVRPADIAGLTMWNGKLFMLSRNDEELCHVDKNTLTVISCESFKNAISTVKYDSDKFGVVEGVAITNDYIYMIIDNNNMNIKGTSDNRSRLLVFYNELSH